MLLDLGRFMSSMVGAVVVMIIVSIFLALIGVKGVIGLSIFIACPVTSFIVFMVLYSDREKEQCRRNMENDRVINTMYQSEINKIDREK